MIVRLCLVAILAISVAKSADHGTFKDCSRVDFCTNFRNTPAQDSYSPDANSITTTDSQFSVNLKGGNGASDLVLKVTGLESDTFRVEIAEPDSDRYRLVDVLDGEPKAAQLTYTGDERTFTARNPNGNDVKVTYSPFNIEFVRDGNSEVVVNGATLSMLRNDVNAPFRVGFTFPQAAQLYGAHEHADKLALRSTADRDPYRLKNSDVAYYELDSPMALYGAVPVIYGHGRASTAGVFLHNAAEQWIEIDNEQTGSQTAFYAEAGALDLFVFLGPTPRDVVRQYTALTGTAHLPQVWALGYHQSRYSYMSQDDVRGVMDGFIASDIQVDAIWLDIDYTDGYRYFTWNPDTFSDPVGLQDYIGAQNRKLIAISDPHIKAEPGYAVYDRGLAADVFVKNPDGSVFQGPCWPGMSAYVDYLSPAARDFYAGLYAFDFFNKTTPVLAGIWNDMNEPSVFDNSLEMTLPADGRHFGGVRHREMHNAYGFLQTKATHQGLLARDGGRKRPFILTRSHFAGSQRYALFWTGDNTADWGYVAVSYPECLNAGILGIVFCGADMGGYFGDPDMELLSRWYQAGAWLPFFRAHATLDTARREPYLLPPEWQDRVRATIENRYKHLPVWYTRFYEHVRTGEPVIRPLFYEYADDVHVYQIEDQLVVGKDILVKPVTAPGEESLLVYFPGGEGEKWLALNGDDVKSGNGYANVPVTQDFIPVYYRQGSIIPLKETKRPSTVEMKDDPYTLVINLDANNEASGTLYIDDFESFNYENGDFKYYKLTSSGDIIDIETLDGNGNFDLNLAKLVVNKVEPSTSGNKTVYTQRVIDKDASGKLLKDIKISGKFTLKFA